ncbi:hypothetical protein [Microcoleus sp. CAWBG556]|uniref:hypothetical protein n=1 Tax=Microcoleus sp. CAWBG556 TaxID=2841650 RepID=UPI0025F84E90|nr:hypothetical protein [Microcoleus sp. CAWBG556]
MAELSELLWDVGAGCGSIALPWMRTAVQTVDRSHSHGCGRGCRAIASRSPCTQLDTKKG